MVEEKGVDAIGAVVDRVNESRSLVRLAPPRSWTRHTHSGESFALLTINGGILTVLE